MVRETYSYKGWLNSDSFLKRAFAIFGYGLIPLLIIYGSLMVLIFAYYILFFTFS